jgi:hypothetical protein
MKRLIASVVVVVALLTSGAVVPQSSPCHYPKLSLGHGKL